MYTGCVTSLYRGRRGPPYRIGNAGPFGTSRYEANLYIVEPPLDPVLELNKRISQLSYSVTDESYACLVTQPRPLIILLV